MLLQNWIFRVVIKHKHPVTLMKSWCWLLTQRHWRCSFFLPSWKYLSVGFIFFFFHPCFFSIFELMFWRTTSKKISIFHTWMVNQWYQKRNALSTKVMDEFHTIWDSHHPFKINRYPCSCFPLTISEKRENCRRKYFIIAIRSYMFTEIPWLIFVIFKFSATLHL